MTELNEAPWFDALSDADAASYIASTAELIVDMRKAARFMNRVANMRAFPIRSYQPEIDISYFVNQADADPKGDFERIAANIVAAGGTVEHRSDQTTVHHVASLPFGSGRVAYRVVWIEQLTTE